MIVFFDDNSIPIFESSILFLVREEVRKVKVEDLQEKLFSPKETCKLFNPKISLVTLDTWSEKGFLNKHYIGGRTYYKYSEVMNSLQTLKKYQRQPITSTSSV